jgi:hypothetical protein
MKNVSAVKRPDRTKFAQVGQIGTGADGSNRPAFTAIHGRIARAD